MKCCDDMANLPKPHIVFNASKFQTAAEWHDQDEAKEWDSRCIVSFQPNAWVDAQTRMHGLKEVLGPIDKLLEIESTSVKGVVVEDNLSSHKTDDVIQYWKSELPHYTEPRFIPANMTMVLQVVDRHIGVRYKEAVYKEYRKTMTKSLREARKSNPSAIVQAMTPREKRILITKTIGSIHEKLAKTDLFQRAFVATGTLLPVKHLMRNESGAIGNCSIVSPEEESMVKLQHFPEYKYSVAVTADKVHGVIDKIAADKAVEEAEMNHLRAAREAHYQSEKVIMKPFVELSEKLIPALEDKLIAYIGDILTTIHKETGLEQFLVAGSWSSAMIAKVLSEWDHCNDLKEIG
jgi:hypothetical protein